MECPTCGRSFSSGRGMRQHHTKMHDVRLPNRTCSDCGVEFYDSDARLEYCPTCNPNSGKNNGNWQNAKVRVECERCGSEFGYYPSNKKGVYCPTCVSEADEFLGDHYVEVHDIARLQRECDFCGIDISVLVSERESGAGRFCSRECLSNWMSENRRGKDHHHWLPGDSTYTGQWWEARRTALERDDYQCQYCGKTAEEIGRNPDVHHITPLRSFENPHEAHEIGNLISLCRSCHRRVESGIIEGPEPDS